MKQLPAGFVIEEDKPSGYKSLPDGFVLEDDPSSSPTPEAGYGEVFTKALENVSPATRVGLGGTLQGIQETPIEGLQNIVASGEKPKGILDFYKKGLQGLVGKAQIFSTLLPALLSPEGKQMREEAQQELAANQPNVPKGSVKDYIGSATTSVAQNAIPLAASLLTKSPFPSLGAAGVQSFGQSYGEQRDAGQTPSQAFLPALGSAGAEVAMEKLPLGILMKEGGSLFGRALKSVGSEGATEALTQFVQDGIKKGTISPNMTFGQMMSNAKDAGIVGSIAGGAMGTIAHPFARGKTKVVATDGSVKDDGGKTSFNLENELNKPSGLPAVDLPTVPADATGFVKEGEVPSQIDAWQKNKELPTFRDTELSPATDIDTAHTTLNAIKSGNINAVHPEVLVDLTKFGEIAVDKTGKPVLTELGQQLFDAINKYKQPGGSFNREQLDSVQNPIADLLHVNPQTGESVLPSAPNDVINPLALERAVKENVPVQEPVAPELPTSTMPDIENRVSAPEVASAPEAKAGTMEERATPQEEKDFLNYQLQQQEMPKKVIPANKLEDVGEEIGGARKDRWKDRGLQLSDLEGMKVGEQHTHIKKDNVWPKIDYKKNVEAGADPIVERLKKKLRDAVRLQPEYDTKDGREGYVDQISRIYRDVNQATTIEELQKIYSNADKYLHEIGYKSNGSFVRAPSKELRQRVYTAIKNYADLHISPYDIAKAKREIESKNWPFLTSKTRTSSEKSELPKRPHLDNLKREGEDWRNGKDVTGNDFLKDFKFRGVEYGNWVDNSERQYATNLAYDALHDFAKILGIPPEAISLGGRLGMAFGARGSGKNAAHYEPGKIVINLTKTSGAGSLAHEWGHALDHYLGELDTNKGDASAGVFSSGGSNTYHKEKLSNLRHEVQEAFDNVMQKLFKRNKTQAEDVRDLELKLEKAQSNIRIAKKNKEYDNNKSYQKKMDEYIVFHEERTIPKLEKELQEARGEKYDRSIPVETSFMNEASKLGGAKTGGINPYWKQPTEMFARAFESYTFDKIKDEGNVSDYLVHGVEEDRYADRDRYKGNPYPIGDERIAINKAFDNLLQTLQIRENDKGLKTLYSVTPTEKLTANKEVIKDNLNKIIRRINPSVKTEFSDKMFGEGEALKASGATTTERQEVAGSFNALHNLIKASLNVEKFDPTDTAYHEAYHSIRDMVNDADNSILMKAFPGTDRYSQSEHEAIEFARFMTEKNATGFSPAVRRIFLAIKQALRDIGRSLKLGGFNSIEDIFNRVERGTIYSDYQNALRNGDIQAIRDTILTPEQQQEAIKQVSPTLHDIVYSDTPTSEEDRLNMLDVVADAAGNLEDVAYSITERVFSKVTPDREKVLKGFVKITSPFMTKEQTETMMKNQEINIKNTRDETKEPLKMNSGMLWTRNLVQSNDGSMRYVAAKYKSRIISQIADMFYHGAGQAKGVGSTYFESISDYVGTTMHKVGVALQDLNEKQLDQVTEILQNPTVDYQVSPKVKNAALVLGQVIKDQRAYLEKAGLPVVSQIEGYFPRVYDSAKVVENQKGFLDAAVKAYQATYPEISTSEAMELAEKWMNNILLQDQMGGYGSDTDNFHIMSDIPPAPDETKSRVLTKEADSIMRDFLMRNPADVMYSSVGKAARAAEFNRRFNDEAWTAMKAEMRAGGIDEEGMRQVMNAIRTNVGMNDSIRGQVRNFNGLLRYWSNVAFLPRSAFSSLSEGFTVATKTGNPVDGLRTMYDGFRAAIGTEGSQEMRDVSDMYGITGEIAEDMMMAQRTGGEFTSKKRAYMNKQFFKTIGMTQITSGQLSATFKTGQFFMGKLAEHIVNNHNRKASSEFMISELGVPKDKMQEFAKWVDTNGGGRLSTEFGLGNSEMAALYRTAMRRFVQTTIQVPTPATRQRYASTPVGQFAFGLTSYIYSYSKNVLIRNARIGKEVFATGKGYTAADRAAFAMQVSMVPVLMLLAAGVGELRDEIFKTADSKKKTTSERIVTGLSRGGAFGGLDPYVNMWNNLKYQKDPLNTFNGPLPSAVTGVIKSGIGLFYTNSPNTNTAERTAIKQLYGMGIAPVITSALATNNILPGAWGLLPYLAVQAVNSPQVKGKVADTVAGKKKSSYH